MTTQLSYSMFHDVLFPADEVEKGGFNDHRFFLRQLIRFTPPPELPLSDASLVIFDFETTGLSPVNDRIIEIGAQKIKGSEVIDEFSTLICPDVELSQNTISLTGLSAEILKDQPKIEEVLPKFLKFIEQGILVAHNAEFDFSFLKAASARLGIDLDWPCFCTLKLSKIILPELSERNLDALARHFGFNFEARHRSIGDVKVTASVLKAMLSDPRAQMISKWCDISSIYVR